MLLSDEENDDKDNIFMKKFSLFFNEQIINLPKTVYEIKLYLLSTDEHTIYDKQTFARVYNSVPKTVTKINFKTRGYFYINNIMFGVKHIKNRINKKCKNNMIKKIPYSCVYIETYLYRSR